MRRIILSIVLLAAFVSATLASVGLPLGPGSVWPLGPSGFTGSLSAPTNYYVSNGGSDAANGLTQATAWQTITHVNAQVFPVNSVVNFLGGQTFSGSLALTLTNAPSGYITIKSFGAGQATISSGNSAACAAATDVPSVIISNIICTGGGNLSNTTAGISVVNDQAGNTKIQGPTISGVTVSGYGYNGISVQGSNGTSGFNGTTIVNNIIHDVTGNSTDAFGTACIYVFSKTGNGSGTTAPAHINGTINGNTCFNATGTVGSTNWTGSGALVSEASGFQLSNNLVHDFGVNASTFDPVGVWTQDSINVTISFNEVYDGVTLGDGFDCDQGTINCVIEYNKAHDNAGWNYLASHGGTIYSNNTFRFNLGQNSAKGEFRFFFITNATGPLYIYNNTFSNHLGHPIFSRAASESGTITGTIANNIAAESGGNLLTIGTPGSLSFTGNDYFTYGQPTNYSWNGTTYTSFSAWQTTTGQEKIAGINVGLIVDPKLYVSGGLFSTSGYQSTQDMANNLQSGSPMIGTGLNLQTQFNINPGSTDYYGTTIFPASLPIGAANGDFATFAPSCVAATNFLTRILSFNKLDNVNYNSLLCGENTDGDLALLDSEYMLAAPNSAASLLNVISTSYSLVAHGATTFTARTGIAGDGSTGYLDTQLIPPGTNATLNSTTLGIYNLTSRAGSNTPNDLGNNTATGGAGYNDINMLTGPGTAGFCAVNEGGSGNGYSAPTTITNYFLICQRTASNAAQSYINGIVSGGGTTEVSDGFSGAVSVYLLAGNFQPTSGYTTDQLSAAIIGSGTISALHISQRINAFMRAYGINTY